MRIIGVHSNAEKGRGIQAGYENYDEEEEDTGLPEMDEEVGDEDSQRLNTEMAGEKNGEGEMEAEGTSTSETVTFSQMKLEPGEIPQTGEMTETEVPVPEFFESNEGGFNEIPVTETMEEGDEEGGDEDSERLNSEMDGERHEEEEGEGTSTSETVTLSEMKLEPGEVPQTGEIQTEIEVPVPEFFESNEGGFNEIPVTEPMEEGDKDHADLDNANSEHPEHIRNIEWDQDLQTTETREPVTANVAEDFAENPEVDNTTTTEQYSTAANPPEDEFDVEYSLDLVYSNDAGNQEKGSSDMEVDEGEEPEIEPGPENDSDFYDASAYLQTELEFGSDLEKERDFIPKGYTEVFFEGLDDEEEEEIEHVDENDKDCSKVPQEETEESRSEAEKNTETFEKVASNVVEEPEKNLNELGKNLEEDGARENAAFPTPPADDKIIEEEEALNNDGEKEVPIGEKNMGKEDEVQHENDVNANPVGNENNEERQNERIIENDQQSDTTSNSSYAEDKEDDDIEVVGFYSGAPCSSSNFVASLQWPLPKIVIVPKVEVIDEEQDQEGNGGDAPPAPEEAEDEFNMPVIVSVRGGVSEEDVIEVQDADSPEVIAVFNEEEQDKNAADEQADRDNNNTVKKTTESDQASARESSTFKKGTESSTSGRYKSSEEDGQLKSGESEDVTSGKSPSSSPYPKSNSDSHPSSEIASPNCVHCKGNHYSSNCYKKPTGLRKGHQTRQKKNSIPVPPRYWRDPRRRLQYEGRVERNRLDNLDKGRNINSSSSSNESDSIEERMKVYEKRFKPGVLSPQTRKAMGLKVYQLPSHIYQMRKIGYPPGWLEYAAEPAEPEQQPGSSTFGYPVQSVPEGPERPRKLNISKLPQYIGFTLPVQLPYVDEGRLVRIPFQEYHRLPNIVKQWEAQEALRCGIMPPQAPFMMPPQTTGVEAAAGTSYIPMIPTTTPAPMQPQQPDPPSYVDVGADYADPYGIPQCSSMPNPTQTRTRVQPRSSTQESSSEGNWFDEFLPSKPTSVHAQVPKALSVNSVTGMSRGQSSSIFDFIPKPQKAQTLYQFQTQVIEAYPGPRNYRITEQLEKITEHAFKAGQKHTEEEYRQRELEEKAKKGEKRPRSSSPSSLNRKNEKEDTEEDRPRTKLPPFRYPGLNSPKRKRTRVEKEDAGSNEVKTEKSSPISASERRRRRREEQQKKSNPKEVEVIDLDEDDKEIEEVKVEKHTRVPPPPPKLSPIKEYHSDASSASDQFKSFVVPTPLVILDADASKDNEDDDDVQCID